MRYVAGAETVFMVERNMGNADMRGTVVPAGVEEPHHAQKDCVGSWEIPRLTSGNDAALVRIGKARSRSR